MTVVGADFQQMDFKVVQGAGETRIAAAARMHPVIVGLSEGLQGSSLNAGNFNSARRLVADATLRPLWRNAAASLANIVDLNSVRTTRGSGVELWYDDRDIYRFLQEDMKDRAGIHRCSRSPPRRKQKTRSTGASILKSVVHWLDLRHRRHHPASASPGLVSVQTAAAGSGGAEHGFGCQ